MLSPFKLARHCWLPSCSIFGKRTNAPINRTSHHLRGGVIIFTLDHPNSPSTGAPLLRRLFFLCTVHPQPKRQSTTPHWSRVLHHNGGPNQYKPRVSCVVHHFHLSSHERIRRRSVGERSPRAPQCSNLKGLPEPEIRHLARQVGVRRDSSSTTPFSSDHHAHV